MMAGNNDQGAQILQNLVRAAVDLAAKGPLGPGEMRGNIVTFPDTGNQIIVALLPLGAAATTARLVETGQRQDLNV